MSVFYCVAEIPENKMSEHIKKIDTERRSKIVRRKKKRN